MLTEKEKEYDAALEKVKLKRLSDFQGSRKKIKIECYCGNIFETTPHHIMSGNTRSCGCYKIQRIKETKLIDLTGKRFGKLVVIKYLKTTPNRKVVWLCKCDCGVEREIRGCSLNNGSTISCGCRKLQGYRDISKTYWSKVIGRSRKSNIHLSITIKEAWEIFEKQEGKCALTGLPIFFTKFYNQEQRKQTASLDRIDSDGGYIIDNVQWVHKEINWMKRCLTNEEFINFCHLVVEQHPLKDNAKCDKMKNL